MSLMHRSFWNDIGDEFKEFFARWPVAIVGLTVVPGLVGALFVSPEGSTTEGRIIVALASAAVALLFLCLSAVFIALIRVPIKGYRQRHLQAKLGQECIDCAREIVGAIGQAALDPNDTGKTVRVNFFRADADKSITKVIEQIKELSEAQLQAFCFRYETDCAARVYRCATELFDHGHIDQAQRDKLRNATPTKHHKEPLTAALIVLESVQALVHIGVRLGGQAVTASPR